MLKGEAINFGKQLKKAIEKQTETAVFMANAEELKQFLDVALWEMEHKND